MNSQIFAYLKRKQLTDTRTVNRLFVSSFVSLSDLRIENNHIIKGLLIDKNDKDFDLLQEFISKIRHFHPTPMIIEDMISLFEFVVSPADRIVTGAVYTPRSVRKKIIETCLNTMPNEQMQHVRVADIACGCGGLHCFYTIIQGGHFVISIKNQYMGLMPKSILWKGQKSCFHF